ncbi:LAGLIDADG family homing endonuclease [Streptomyces sp. NPDC003730]
MAEREPNGHQFMDLTVPEYAYMFGFLQADGHLRRGPGQKGSLTVEINAEDIGVLYAFQRLTPYYSSVTERTRTTNFAKTHRSAVWSLCSLEARTRVNELGIPYGRKSDKIAPPEAAHSSLDYLRGLVDADGSVGYTAAGYPFISLTSASTAVIAYLCLYAGEITGTRRNPRRNQRDAIYNLVYVTEAAKELCSRLYYPGCLSLSRKQQSAIAVAAWTRATGTKPRPSPIDWTPEMDRDLLKAPTIARAAAALGYSTSACQQRRWKLLHGLVPLPD